MMALFYNHIKCSVFSHLYVLALGPHGPRFDSYLCLYFPFFVGLSFLIIVRLVFLDFLSSLLRDLYSQIFFPPYFVRLVFSPIECEVNAIVIERFFMLDYEIHLYLY